MGAAGWWEATAARAAAGGRRARAQAAGGPALPPTQAACLQQRPWPHPPASPMSLTCPIRWPCLFWLTPLPHQVPRPQ
jgi:hypothetical protein